VTESIVALLLLAAALLGALAWLWGPPLAAEFRRAQIRRQPFPRAWRDVLQRRWAGWQQLPADLQLQVKKHTQVLLAEKPFIGCRGLVLTDEMRVLIAAQASLLLLNRRAGYFRNLRQVLVYPGAFVVDRAVNEGGVVRDERRALAGESWQQGQLILSWDDVLQGAAKADDGRNVVIHEFAHQLDQEAGRANGAPWLATPARRRRWAAVMEQEFGQLRQRLTDGEHGLIDPYAATDPAEFFAVVSEVFFEQPGALAAAHPALFREFAQYYATNPLHWR
jgi:Mlc titration factor MtfA (ptsG expression regulator)